MTRITIDVQNEEDRQLIQNLLKRLGIANSEEVAEMNTVDNGSKVAALMQKLADHGGISSIKDPIAWQKEIRTDTKLPF